MAEALFERSLDWVSDFADVLSDAGEALPFDLSVPARTEPTAGIYDVGELVREYQLSWLGKAPNHATPIELRQLLAKLEGLTQQLEDSAVDHAVESSTRAAELGLAGLMSPTLGPAIWAFADKSRRGEQRSLEQVRRDLERWRARLDDYTAKVEAAIAATPTLEQDRKAVLWSVTAPLLLGWYGGPTGVELPLVGQPETFNPKLQHLADVGEPYRIANQLGVWLEWRERRKELLIKDLKDGAKEQGSKAGWIALAAVAGVGVGVGAAYAFRRKS